MAFLRTGRRPGRQKWVTSGITGSTWISNGLQETGFSSITYYKHFSWIVFSQKIIFMYRTKGFD